MLHLIQLDTRDLHPFDQCMEAVQQDDKLVILYNLLEDETRQQILSICAQLNLEIFFLTARKDTGEASSDKINTNEKRHDHKKLSVETINYIEIDYNALVDLCCSQPKIITWY